MYRLYMLSVVRAVPAVLSWCSSQIDTAAHSEHIARSQIPFSKKSSGDQASSMLGAVFWWGLASVGYRRSKPGQVGGVASTHAPLSIAIPPCSIPTLSTTLTHMHAASCELVQSLNIQHHNHSYQTGCGFRKMTPEPASSHGAHIQHCHG